MRPGGRSRRAQKRVAFVLTGGAVRGAAQVGMLQALTEAGVRPDFIVGTSVGALNGAVFGQEPTRAGLEHLAALWVTAPRSQIFPLSPAPIARNLRRRAGYALDNSGLRRWIESHAVLDRLEHFPVPLHVVATDAASGEPVVLSRGDTVEVLLATSAIPRVFPEIQIDGRSLLDGGASADAPVSQAVDLGATTVYLLPTSPPVDARSAPWWWLADRLVGTPPTATPVIDLRHVEVHRMPAPQADSNPLTFRSSRRLIDEARTMGQDFLTGLASPTPSGLSPSDAG